MNRMGAKDLFNQSGLALLRDAWIAAEFGRIQEAEHVRLDASVPRGERDVKIFRERDAVRNDRMIIALGD